MENIREHRHQSGDLAKGLGRRGSQREARKAEYCR